MAAGVTDVLVVDEACCEGEHEARLGCRRRQQRGSFGGLPGGTAAALPTDGIPSPVCSNGRWRSKRAIWPPDTPSRLPAKYAHHDRVAGLREASSSFPAPAVKGPRRARKVGALGVLFAAALATFAVSPALADEQVGVTDNFFAPPGVAVKPGETVTWNNPGTSDIHNVNFEDGVSTTPGRRPERGPWTEARTFPTEGTFRYYCEEHGSPGGVGMSGVVHVNSTGTVPGVAPAASFTVSPSTARVGQDIAFNAAGTSDPDAGDSIIRYEWDFDGDGFYETDTGQTSSTSTSYPSAGMRTVKLRVTDSQGHANVTTRTVTVTNQPIASFTVSPSPAQTGQTVMFNGSASSDPDGAVARYEWDLDGNGSFETDGGTAPTTSRSYSSPATLTVRLRVTDNLGVASETTRSLQVNAPAQPPADPPPSMMPAPPVFPTAVACSSLKGAQRTACMQKRCRTLKGAKRAACISRSCRYLKNAKRTACIQKSCRYVARSKRTSCKRKSCRFLTGSKKRACLRKYSRPRTRSSRR